MIAFLLSDRARNGENFTGDSKSPTASVLRVRDMASCGDFVSFSLKFQRINFQTTAKGEQRKC